MPPSMRRMWNSSRGWSGRLAIEKSRAGRPSKATLAYWPAAKVNGPPASTSSTTRRTSWVSGSTAATRQPSTRRSCATAASGSGQATSQSLSGSARQARIRPRARSSGLRVNFE